MHPVSPLQPQSSNHGSKTVQVFNEKKNLCISGPTQFKPMLLYSVLFCLSSLCRIPITWILYVPFTLFLFSIFYSFFVSVLQSGNFLQCHLSAVSNLLLIISIDLFFHYSFSFRILLLYYIFKFSTEILSFVF